MSQLLGAVLVSLLVGARTSTCQETVAELGLRASGGVSVFMGGGRAVHDVPGGELGAAIDLGWAWSERLRLMGDASWFVGRLREYVPQDDEEFSGPVYDLSGSVSLLALIGSPASRQAIYAGLGLSIHALSSSFRSIPLDRRYNANRFGVTGTLGGRMWLGQAGRSALFAELREFRVSDMNRWSVRMGIMRNFDALARPRRS
ncbi:MAG: hypothetical protein MNPFHGCM_01793 [Gemmatimonadaceae bacterium]|nr:hypothetical protein [Gemmatimonadaceae bacterium]